MGGRKRGSLKEATIETLSNYYGKAIRNNVRNVQEIEKAIYATIYHCASTDNNPQHQYCPLGPNSWCFYQASIARKKNIGSHSIYIKTPLNEVVFEKILPIYKKLAEKNLLQRCSAGKTQNANEHFHSRIWRKCPKTKFVFKSKVQIAVDDVICEYNSGITKVTLEKQKALGLQVSDVTLNIANQRDIKREDQIVTRKQN